MNLKNKKTTSGAFLVAAGILLSRIAGLIRERIFAYYFGNSDVADCYKAALKIPNFLQNLFGEGVLSASFIPVYANLIASQNKEDQVKAGNVASIIFTFLMLFISVLVLMGIIITPKIINFVAPGFSGEKKILTIKMVQIFFPGTGILVLSAWCLGILNSHRRFFLSYTAPVLWNISIILSMLVGNYFLSKSHNSFDLSKLGLIASWGLVLGSCCQFLIQFPSVIKLLPQFKLSINYKISEVKTIFINFIPVLISRGAVQVSAYIDSMIASLLPGGAVSTLAYAQTIYLLPISLFGMSISASELPALSAIQGQDESERYQQMALRLENGLERIAFFIIPSAMAFLSLGDLISAILFQSGRFTSSDSNLVWWALAGSSVGLLASTLGRLYSSTFYALKDTKSPLNFALVRVFFTIILGYLMAVYLPHHMSLPKGAETLGLTMSAGIAGWIEFYLLKTRLGRKIKIKTGLTFNLQIKLWASAFFSAAIAYAIKTKLPQFSFIKSMVIIGIYGISYFICTYFLKINESRLVFSKIAIRFKR